MVCFFLAHGQNQQWAAPSKWPILCVPFQAEQRNHGRNPRMMQRTETRAARRGALQNDTPPHHTPTPHPHIFVLRLQTPVPPALPPSHPPCQPHSSV